MLIHGEHSDCQGVKYGKRDADYSGFHQLPAPELIYDVCKSVSDLHGLESRAGFCFLDSLALPSFFFFFRINKHKNKIGN